MIGNLILASVGRSLCKWLITDMWEFWWFYLKLEGRTCLCVPLPLLPSLSPPSSLNGGRNRIKQIAAKFISRTLYTNALVLPLTFRVADKTTTFINQNVTQDPSTFHRVHLCGVEICKPSTNHPRWLCYVWNVCPDGQTVLLHYLIHLRDTQTPSVRRQVGDTALQYGVHLTRGTRNSHSSLPKGQLHVVLHLTLSFSFTLT